MFEHLVRDEASLEGKVKSMEVLMEGGLIYLNVFLLQRKVRSRSARCTGPARALCLGLA